jgi:hypothetical protein
MHSTCTYSRNLPFFKLVVTTLPYSLANCEKLEIIHVPIMSVVPPALKVVKRVEFVPYKEEEVEDEDDDGWDED